MVPSQPVHRWLPGLMALLLSAACATSASAKPSAQTSRPAEVLEAPSAPTMREFPPREDLPLAARRALTARMARHGEAMSLLLASVVYLEHEGAELLATQIANEPKIDRPHEGGTDSFNALLPKSFFDYQDALYVSVAELASAARRHEDLRLAKAFGTLTGTCVACHAAYLHDALDAKPAVDTAGESALSTAR